MKILVLVSWAQAISTTWMKPKDLAKQPPSVLALITRNWFAASHGVKLAPTMASCRWMAWGRDQCWPLTLPCAGQIQCKLIKNWDVEFFQKFQGRNVESVRNFKTTSLLKFFKRVGKCENAKICWQMLKHNNYCIHMCWSWNTPNL